MEKHYLRISLFSLLMVAIFMFWGFMSFVIIKGLIVNGSTGLILTFLKIAWSLLSGIAIGISIWCYYVKKLKASFLSAIFPIISFFVLAVVMYTFFNPVIGP